MSYFKITRSLKYDMIIVKSGKTYAACYLRVRLLNTCVYMFWSAKREWDSCQADGEINLFRLPPQSKLLLTAVIKTYMNNTKAGSQVLF